MAGAAPVWKIFSAFCTVNVNPQPAGTRTINHATAINAGELFLTVSSDIALSLPSTFAIPSAAKDVYFVLRSYNQCPDPTGSRFFSAIQCLSLTGRTSRFATNPSTSSPVMMCRIVGYASCLFRWFAT